MLFTALGFLVGLNGNIRIFSKVLKYVSDLE